MSVKETTSFTFGDFTVSVTGPEIIFMKKGAITGLTLSRQEAKDLSRAMQHASEIVRTSKAVKFSCSSGEYTDYEKEGWQRISGPTYNRDTILAVPRTKDYKYLVVTTTDVSGLVLNLMRKPKVAKQD